MEDHRQPLVVHTAVTKGAGFLTFSCRRSGYCPLKGAAEASQHDGKTHDAASSESPTMAGVACKASHVESRGLARVLQGPHRGKVDPLRRHRSRGALLRMDRQSYQTSR